MVSRRDDLETRLVATDAASKVIDKVADKYEKIPDQVDTTISADDKATPQLRSIVDRLEGLSKEDQTIVLQASAKDAQREIDRILRALGRVHDMDDEEVQVRISALDKAKGDLDRIQAEMADLDGETAEVRVEATGLDGILTKLGSLPGKFGELGSALSGALGPIAAGGGVTAGVVAIAAGLAAAANAAADTALEAATMSKLTGDTVEDASKLQQIWQTTGADVNDLNDIVVQLNGALQQSPELAGKIGINLDDGKTALQRFVQVVDLADKGLVSMTDQSTLFGEEGIRQVAALTSRYDDLSRVVADMEPPVTKEDAEQALVLKGAIADLTVEFHKLALEIGQVAVPALEEALHKAEPFLKLLGLMGDQIEKSGAKAKSGTAGWKEADAMFAAGFSNIDEWRRVQPIFAGIDAAVAGTADSSADLADSTGDLSAQQKLYNLRLALTLVQLGAYANDQADAGEQTGELMEAVKQAAQGILDYQETIDSLDWKNLEGGKGAIEGAVSAWDEIVSQRFGLDTIFKNTEDAWHGLGDAITDENGKVRLSMDLTTERGQAINDALQELAQQSVPQVAAAFAESGGSWQKFRTEMEAMRLRTIARLMDDFGLAADDAEALADKIVGTTGDWKATYELSGTEEAQAKLGLLQTSLDGLPDEVKTKVTQQIITGDYKGALKTIQDYYDGHAVTLKIIPVVQDVIGGLGLGIGVGGTAAVAPTARGAVAVAPTSMSATVPVAVVPAPAAGRTQVVNQYMTFNAGTIGGGFDVMTAVSEAMRRSARLMPKNP